MAGESSGPLGGNGTQTPRDTRRMGTPLTLDPITEAGSGAVQEKERVYLEEIIEKLNGLFGADTTDQDQLVYVNHDLKEHLRDLFHTFDSEQIPGTFQFASRVTGKT